MMHHQGSTAPVNTASEIQCLNAPSRYHQRSQCFNKGYEASVHRLAQGGCEDEGRSERPRKMHPLW